MATTDSNGDWVGEFNGERDCSSDNGCLFWNASTKQWEKDDPRPSLSWWDFPGHWFVGFGDFAFNNQPSGLARMGYAYAGQIGSGYAVSAAAKGATTAWQVRNARFAQATARESFSRLGRFAGQSVDEVAEALRTGALKPEDVPVEFVVKDGVTLLANTRSTVALTIAGVGPARWKLIDATANFGTNLRVANQLAGHGMTSAGTSSVVLNPSKHVIFLSRGF